MAIVISRFQNHSTVTAKPITNPLNTPNSTRSSLHHISISKTINITPYSSSPRRTTSICRARVLVRDDKIVQYYRADALYGELKKVESEEDDPNIDGRRCQKTATERDAEAYKRARSKYALTNGQDAEVMR
jgi:hypothetical protein